MKYRCVKCGKIWELENGCNESKHGGGLCKPCLRESLTPLYRRRQLREGNFDCFGKATSFCDQFQCLYRRNCLVDDLCNPEAEISHFRQIA